MSGSELVKELVEQLDAANARVRELEERHASVCVQLDRSRKLQANLEAAKARVRELEVKRDMLRYALQWCEASWTQEFDRLRAQRDELAGAMQQSVDRCQLNCTATSYCGRCEPLLAALAKLEVKP